MENNFVSDFLVVLLLYLKQGKKVEPGSETQVKVHCGFTEWQYKI